MKKEQILKTYFGYNYFRNGQAELVDTILSGKDVVAIMPTGAGKSLCYQIPALMLDGITIVISPLISLMKDQVFALKNAGISAAYINSSLTYPQYLEVFRRALNGVYKIIYVAPERLLTEEFIDFAQKVKISMITVDEAHCISQWGQDFRPSYTSIYEFIEKMPSRPIVSAFTATATTTVRDDIIAKLRLSSPFVKMTGFDRSNLYFEVRQPAKKIDELHKIMQDNTEKCVIIYCNTRKNVELVYDELLSVGVSVAKYHAGLSDEKRKEAQEQFISGEKRIMVATNAFGMGIDKADVSLVLHYNMPKDLESYYQEAGRAGRNGKDAKCILLYGGQDYKTNEFMIERSYENNEELSVEEALKLKQRERKKLSIMTNYSVSSDCLRAYILRYFGEKTTSFCGNCSSCNRRSDARDITTEAMKIISCVIRMKNAANLSFGVFEVASVLKGENANYRGISTFGIMMEIASSEIISLVELLIYKEYLTESSVDFGKILVPTDKAVSVIKNSEKVVMRVKNEKKSASYFGTQPNYTVKKTIDSKPVTQKKSTGFFGTQPDYISKKTTTKGKTVDENSKINIDKDKLIADYKAGKSLSEIAKGQNASLNDIRKAIFKLGLN